MDPEIIKVKSYEEYLEHVGELPNKQWVFRGHSHKEWLIESTLARFVRHHDQNIAKGWIDGRELESIRKFQKAGHQFLQHLPEEDDILSWLAVMRHFGAPTRLIDFTHSPYTALFFAVSNPYRSFDDLITIHAVNTQSVMQGALQVLGRLAKPDLRCEDLMIGKGKAQLHEFAAFFEGKWDSPRQVAQQGLFMVTSKIEMSVEDYLRSCPKLSSGGTPWRIFQFRKGREVHKKVTNFLLKANLTHASLYPGLEGLAQSLHMKMYEPLPKTESLWQQ